MSVAIDDDHTTNDGEPYDVESGEVLDTPAVTQRSAPRVRTIDQIVALANGGEYPDDMQHLIAEFFEKLLDYAQSHDVKHAPGTLTLAIKATVDRYGEVELDLKPSIKLPDPPCDDGKARLYIDATGTLVTHKQQDLPLMRDVSKPKQKMRDTGAKKGH